ncbi:glycoside hydrolase family 97 protein [Sunxiuqinia sp. A32]|uniref:glycoside hydrolase family 97 protein n=1 Tax=Sunxiuqinia sp. A32 TaxID=3461496 RepID=UPI0040457273
MKLVIRNILFIILIFSVSKLSAEEYILLSPNQKFTIRLTVNDNLEFSVKYKETEIVAPSPISLLLGDETVLGGSSVVESIESNEVREHLYPLLGKNKEILNDYNEKVIHFENSFAIVLRAYDEGVAYRFQTSIGGEIIVKEEEAIFNLSNTGNTIFPTADSNMRSWERAYDIYNTIEHVPEGQFCVTPALFKNGDINVIIAESDLFDYPGMYLIPSGSVSVKGEWANRAKTVSDSSDVYAYHRVLEREEYIAKTNGTRDFPWRVVIATDDDKQLLNNELTYKLASPSKIEDTSWIKPGKSAWEWWHEAILESEQLSTISGKLSLDLYKYYIDFAAEYKLEYITMDAGWGADYAAQVCNYAASKNVKVIMWDFINLPIENPERLTKIKNFGAAGVKIDLIERDDQEAINWLEQLASECAKRELILLLHGCPKPTGLQRTYPNVVSFEAVRGAECAKWDRTPNPDYHTQFPFIRMLAGPLDYTPGSMRNVHVDEFEPVPHGIPMTMGTKAHELAMYILFDQPLAYLCDSPVEYRKNMIAMNFLKKVPTVWDKTLPLDGAVGEFAVMARKKDKDWFLGAMTNTTARTISIDFSFLDENTTYDLEIYRDNEQTVSDAKALEFEIKQVNNKSMLSFDLVKSGGLVMHIKNSNPTGVTSTIENKKIKVYLNNFQNQLNVEASEKIQQVQIFDLLGRMYSFNKISQGEYSVQLNVDSLVPGVYVAGIKTDRSHVLRKFQK